METKKRSKGLLRRFLPLLGRHKGILIFDLLCASLTTVCDLVLPMIVRAVTNTAMYDLPSLTVAFILRLGGLYIFLRLIDCAANFFMASVGHIMGAKIETEMRRRLFSHLQALSFSYYDNTKVGQLMSRITNDLFDVTEFAHHGPEEFFIAFVKITGSFIILSSMNVWLTLIIFAVLPFMIAFAVFFNLRLRTQFKRQRQQIGELNAQVEDSLSGIRVVQSFANDAIEMEKFREGNEGFLAIKKKSYLYMGGFEASNRFFDGLMYILVVVAGGLFVINGGITPADLVAYLLYVSTLLASVQKIVQFAEQFQRGMTGIERYFEVLDAPIEIHDTPGAKPLENVVGNIEFKDVGFSYADDGTEVLSHINLKVKAGDNIALVGPSGGGKTTMCSLIPRFYVVTEGKILLDGRDIRDITLESLRGNIGFVQQDVYLFSGSVYENIEYGKPGATREEVIEAAKQAGAHDFIMQLSDGYDTYVGERGVKLSGGQKQRLLIARALAGHPEILVLDDSSSALDYKTDARLREQIRAHHDDCTKIIIAQRISSVMHAEKILVLDEGRIIGYGSHKQLMATCPLYREIGETQMGVSE